MVVDEAHGAGLHRPGNHGMVMCMGWRAAGSSGCTRSTRHLRRQVVRSCLLAPCSLRASRSPQMRIKYITNKCLRLLSTSLLFTRNVRRGRMTPGLSCFPPSSLVHALCTIGHIQHQSVLSPNTLLPHAYKYRAHSLEDIAPRDTVLLIVSVFFDLVCSPSVYVTSRHT